MWSPNLPSGTIMMKRDIIINIKNYNILEKEQHLKYLLEQPVRGVVLMVNSGNYELKKGIVNSLDNLGNIKTEFGELGGIVSERDKFLVCQVVSILENPICEDKKSLESIRYFQEQDKLNNLSILTTIFVEESGELRVIDGNKRTIAFYENRKDSIVDEIVLPVYFIERKKWKHIKK